MAVLSYEFQVLDATSTGVAGITFGTTAGSSPGIVSINKLPTTVGGALVAISSPTISFLEIANGFYTVQFDVEAQGADVALLLDAGNTLTGANRYILVPLNRDSGRVITSLPSTAPNTAGGLLANVLAAGTAQAGSSSTTAIQLAAGDAGTAGQYVGALLTITGGTGAGQSRVIAAYNASTKVASLQSGRTFAPAPDATSTYIIVSSSYPALNDSLQVVSSSVQGNVTGSVASVTGAVGSVTGLTATNLDVAVSTRAAIADYTTARAAKLDNLDALISSRMASGSVTVGGYSAGQDPGTLVWGAATRTITAFGFTVATDVSATITTNLDAKVSTRAATADARFAHLDADVSSRAAIADYTSARAAKLDDLDAAISSRMPSGATVTTDVSGLVATALDATISSRAATADSRFGHLDADVSSRAATGDARFGHLDADVSSRAATADSRLAHLDADVSSRQPTGAVTVSGTVTLSAAEHTAIAVDTQTGLTAQGYTPTRAGYLDTLNGLVAATTTAVWSALTSAYTGVTGSFGKLLGQFSFNAGSVNAYAVNVDATPGGVVVTVPLILTDAELDPGPAIRNITIARGADFPFTVQCTAADGVTVVNITGAIIEMLAKDNVADLDSAALLSLDNHLVGGIAIIDAVNGIFSVTVPHSATTSTTAWIEQHAYKYAIKVYLLSGIQRVVMAGSIQVGTYAVSSTTAP